MKSLIDVEKAPYKRLGLPEYSVVYDTKNFKTAISHWLAKFNQKTIEREKTMYAHIHINKLHAILNYIKRTNNTS